MNDTECLVTGCQVTPDKTVTLAYLNRPLLFAICAEHAHDLDWGVFDLIQPSDLRGYLGADPVSPPSAA
jgi:hypothetical protein